MTIQRNMGPSRSQSLTYEAVGNKEDFSDILTNISPELTFFLKNLQTAPNAQALEFGWFTEALKPPQMNAHLEKTDFSGGKVGSVEAKKNYCQHFVNCGWVSDAQDRVKKFYNEPRNTTTSSPMHSASRRTISNTCSSTVMSHVPKAATCRHFRAVSRTSCSPRQ